MEVKFNFISTIFVIFLIVMSIVLIVAPIGPSSKNAMAGTVALDYAFIIGGSGYESGYGLAVAGDGSVYTSGLFGGTVDFDPGAGVVNLTAVGASDTYIAKYDSLGNLLWAKAFSGAGNTEWAYSLDLDSQNSVYITGWINGTVDFDPGAGTANLSSAGVNDAFVAKLDSNGDYVWAKKFGSTGNDLAWTITVDASDNVYFAGNFNGTVDFDPGAGTANLTASTSADVYISKLDSNGDYVWAKRLPISSVGGIEHDNVGNIYMAGSYAGTVDFDPGVGVSNMTAQGSTDVYAAKFDSNGNYIWSKSMGGSLSESALSVAVDSSNSVYMTGKLLGSGDYDPGVGTATLTFAGQQDMFVAKLDSDGNYGWAHSIGGNSFDYGYGVVVDSDDNVYVTGGYSGTVDFDPGASVNNLVPADGNETIYLAQYDVDGDYVWAGSFGGDGSVESYSWGRTVATDDSNNVYITGEFEAELAGVTIDADPGTGQNLVTTQGGWGDSFVFKLFPVSIPGVDTASVVSVSGNSALLQSAISSTGGANATDRGFEYGLTNSYGTSIGEAGSYSTGSFSRTLTGLNCSTTYYYRAYATNPAGTTYTAGSTFRTNECGGGLPSAVFQPIQTPLTGFAISINNGAATTNSLNVTINLTVGSDTTGVALSNTTDFGTSVIQPLAPGVTGIPWQLASTASTTVYAKFYNSYGQSSSVVSDSIGVDGNQTPIVPSDQTPAVPTGPILPPPLTGTPTMISANQQFLRNLGYGSVGSDVKALQVFLNANGFTLASSGAGSPGKETNFFGPRTRAAVKKFQLFFKEQILTPLGLTEPTGYFGEQSREQVNQ